MWHLAAASNHFMHIQNTNFNLSLSVLNPLFIINFHLFDSPGILALDLYCTVSSGKMYRYILELASAKQQDISIETQPNSDVIPTSLDHEEHSLTALKVRILNQINLFVQSPLMLTSFALYILDGRESTTNC